MAFRKELDKKKVLEKIIKLISERGNLFKNPDEINIVERKDGCCVIKSISNCCNLFYSPRVEIKIIPNGKGSTFSVSYILSHKTTPEEEKEITEKLKELCFKD